MMKKYIVYSNLCILTLISLLVLIACNNNFNYTGKSLQSQSKQLECQVIEHELGKSCIPFNPQRIIVTDNVSLEILLALNIKPIAAPDPAYVASKANFFGDKMQGIKLLGMQNTLSLEKMVELKPDLIIGLYGFNTENYKLFSRIAPTVSLKYVHREWKETLTNFSQIFGKEEQAERQLINYYHRVKKLQTALGEKLNKIEASISRVHGTQLIEFRSRYSFPGSILHEIGFSEPKAQKELVKDPDDTLIIISPEKFDLLDADYLFVAVDPAATELFNKYQKSSLWQTLKVAQNKQVYTVDTSYWIFGNILSADAILDDLFKYLLDEG